MHYFHFLGNDEMKWREVRCCDWNFWHCSGVSLMSFIPTTSFLVIELSSYKSQLFPPDMIHAKEIICSNFLISLCLSHWWKIAKKTEAYSAVEHSIQTIVGILQFRQISSTAVFPPPKLASIDFLKMNRLHFIKLPGGGRSFLVTRRYLETPSDALKRSLIGESFRKHVKQIKHFAARSSRPKRRAFLSSGWLITSPFTRGRWMARH